MSAILKTKRKSSQPATETVMLAARLLMHGLASVLAEGQLPANEISPAQAEKIATAVSQALFHGLDIEL